MAGKLVFPSAEDLLARILVNHLADPASIRNFVGRLISRARAAASNGHEAGVRIFGVMISLLWARNEAYADEWKSCGTR